MSDNQDVKPAEVVKTPAVDLLKSFLKENHIRLRLSTPKVRETTDGALLIEPSIIIAEYDTPTGS